jgi:hypothetical protein
MTKLLLPRKTKREFAPPAAAVAAKREKGFLLSSRARDVNLERAIATRLLKGLRR